MDLPRHSCTWPNGALGSVRSDPTARAQRARHRPKRATYGGNAGHSRAQGWPLDGRPNIVHVRQSGLVRVSGACCGSRARSAPFNWQGVEADREGALGKNVVISCCWGLMQPRIWCCSWYSLICFKALPQVTHSEIRHHSLFYHTFYIIARFRRNCSIGSCHLFCVEPAVGAVWLQAP